MGCASFLGSKGGAALAYATISVCITFFNKAIFSYYHFKHPGFMTGVQILFSLCFLTVARTCGLVHFPIARKHALGCAGLAVIWVTNVLSGVAALQYLNVPMWSTLRRLTTLITLIGEVVIQNKKHSSKVWGAVSLMFSGALVAGVTDMSYNTVGYGLVGLNDVATALYLILVSTMADKKSLGTLGLLFYLNLFALPLIVGYVVLSGELAEVLVYPQLYQPEFVVVFCLSCAQAFFINLATIWCTQMNSAVTTSVTGQLSKIVTIAVGMFLFAGQKPMTINNVGGVLLGLSGGVYYAWLGLRRQSVASITTAPLSPRQKHGESERLGDGDRP